MGKISVSKLFGQLGTSRLLALAVCFLALQIAPARAADQWTALPFASGWKNYANGYQPVSAVKSGTVVTITGLAQKTGGGNWGHIATLPARMRPSQRLVFNVNTQDRTTRVDVLPTGQVGFVAGNKAAGWVSLDGIAFATGNGTKLGLGAGYSNYGGGYAPATARLIGGRVMVGGLVKAGSGTLIGTLPGTMRPDKRLIFNLNTDDRTARVDVTPNGQMIWMSRAPARSWISLNGIGFEKRSGAGLQLLGGWRNYGGEFRPASWKRVGNRVTLSGLVQKSVTWSHDIGRLPKGQCPDQRLVFNLNSHATTHRVDAITDCRVYWVAGRTGADYLSLDGMSFVLKSGGKVGGNINAQRPNLTPPKGPINPISGGSPSANKSELIADAKNLLNSLGTMARPVREQVENLLRTANHLLREEGQLLRADIKIVNQNATIVIYRPIANQQRVNLALLIKPGQSLKVSNLIAPLGGTPADDLQLANAAYIFVPTGNAQNTTVGKLPPAVRTLVEKVRTGPIEMLAGHNIFSTLNTRDGGPTAALLKLVGVSLGDLKVHIGYGRRVNNDPFIRTGDWNMPFHMANTVFDNATLDLSKWGNVKRLRGWGTAKLHNKPYFLFVQKTGSKGPYPTAAAVDAKSISLKDYKNLSMIFAETVFGSLNAAQTVFKGIDKVPLDKVWIENPRYRVGGALDRDNNPVFANVLLMAASPADTLPDAQKTKGPIILAHGDARVFGIKTGSVNGWVTPNKGMDVEATLDLPKWGGMDLGTFRFDLSRGASKTSYDMYLKGHASVGAGPVKFSENVEIKASTSGFRFDFGQSCPHRPIGVAASVNSHEIGKGSGFSLSAKGNPMTCVADIGQAIVNASGMVSTVSRDAYDNAEKEVRKEMEKIGRQAEKAAKWVGNKISGLFGKKKKKKKPRKPSIEELIKLDCGKNKMQGFVLWQDECRRNWADSHWKSEVTQTTRAQDRWAPCRTQADIRRLEGLIKLVRNRKPSGTKTSIIDKLPLIRLEKELKLTKELAAEKCVTTYEARIARDGNDFSRATTRAQNNPWWEIDLKKTISVFSIAVFAPEGKAEDLNGLVIAMSDSVAGDGLMWDQSGDVLRYRLGAGAVSIINPRKLIRKHGVASSRNVRFFGASKIPDVRHIRIYRPGHGAVSLGEVKVFDGGIQIAK